MKFARLFVSACLPAAVAAALLTPATAHAATATTTFSVTATVATDCAVTATPLAFGSYTGVALNQSSTISVTCTNSTTYNVGLSAGSATGATTSTRKMTIAGGGATLGYQLLTGSYTGTNWGNVVGTDTQSGTGNGAAQTLTVYGVVAGSQYPTPGNYTDTITVTVTY